MSETALVNNGQRSASVLSRLPSDTAQGAESIQPMVLKAAQETLSTVSDNLRLTVGSIAKETGGRSVCLILSDELSISVGGVTVSGKKSAEYRQEG